MSEFCVGISQVRVIAVLAMCAAITSSAATPSGPLEPTYVSMIQLIATPERFDGKVISVVGFLTLGRENDNLYPNQLDAINLIPSSFVHVEVTEEMGIHKTSLDGKYVKIVGTFTVGKDIPFHRGVIRSVRSCDLWSDPNLPISKQLQRIPGVQFSRH